MKNLNKFIVAVFAFVALAFAATVHAQEAPDALIKRISQDVLDIAKADREIQGGNQKRVLELVEAKILPYVDFQRMTALAAGRYWREATPEQQKQLTAEFRDLLVYTYSGAISQVKDQKLDFKPFRAAPTDTEVEVRSQVLQSRGDPIQLNYRLQKSPAGWKIYDINVLGAWLVETYKGNFSSEISKSGIDGLIKTLADKNKRLAESATRSTAKTPKSSF
ncbi:MAG: ABC transporter substrate-binding protein [Oxalobacteraceae bacterium]